LASGAGVGALDHYGILEIAPVQEPPPSQSLSSAAAPVSSPVPLRISIQESLAVAEPVSVSTPESPPSEARFAFVPLYAVPLLSSPQPLTADMLEAEDPDAWIVEARPVPMRPAGPRITALPYQRLPWQSLRSNVPLRTQTLTERLSEISPAASKRLAEKFEAAKAAWPPAEVGLVAIKDEKVLELFARSDGGAWKFIHRYPVLAASGATGPKLRRGDKQVPEGVYGISFLNPNSRYHVSLRVNYPNAFDRRMAAKDGRKDLGGDIMIHGKAVSAGCLAIGDEASEELFVLAAHVGLPKVKLIIAPKDFRRGGVPAVEPGQPDWLPKLYTEVASAMSDFKAPPSTGLLSLFMD
jgi:hypothetical protein